MIKKKDIRGVFKEMMKELIGLRKSKGLNRLALAERVEITREQITNWEEREIIPATDGFIMYCLSLGVDPCVYLNKYFNTSDDK